MRPEFPDVVTFEYKDFGDGMCICAKDIHGQYWYWPHGGHIIQDAVSLDRFQSWVCGVLEDAKRQE